MNQDERDLRDAESLATHNSDCSIILNPRHGCSCHAEENFLTGITHERQRKAEEVTKGFEEWWDKTVNPYYKNHPIPMDVKEAWMAATQLAEQKAQEEIEELKIEFKRLHDIICEGFSYYDERTEAIIKKHFHDRQKQLADKEK